MQSHCILLAAVIENNQLAIEVGRRVSDDRLQSQFDVVKLIVVEVNDDTVIAKPIMRIT